MNPERPPWVALLRGHRLSKESLSQESSPYSFFPADFEARFSTAQTYLRVWGMLTADSQDAKNSPVTDLQILIQQHLAPELDQLWSQAAPSQPAESVVPLAEVMYEEVWGLATILFELCESLHEKETQNSNKALKAQFKNDKLNQLDELYSRAKVYGWGAEALSLVRLFTKVSEELRLQESLVIKLATNNS